MNAHRLIDGPSAMGMTPIYAYHASPEFNLQLHTVLQRLAADTSQSLGQNLHALVLGGGYGRGEGGVVHINGEEHPYNDLDLILIVKQKRNVSWDVLAALSRTYAAELHIHVDFSRPLTLQDIRHWPRWLMWQDLLNGHIVLAGPDDIITAHAPASLRQPLPVIEATRLLLNRGAGLLWATRVARVMEPLPDPDFIRRNYYKCALALGDALLIAYQRFATPYRGHDARLDQLMADSADVAAFQLSALYQAALKFKFCPDHITGRDTNEADLQRLAEKWGAVFLHIEQQRAGQAWPSLTEYTCSDNLREPDQHRPAQRLRNVLRNRQLGTWSTRYPREQLYRRLPALLGLTTSPVNDWPAASAQFLEIWNRFN